MEGAGEAGFPVAALAAVLVLAAVVLAIALFAPDPVLAGRVLSFAAFLGALSAAVVSFRVLALRGPAMDPLAGVALSWRPRASRSRPWAGCSTPVASIRPLGR